MDNLPQDSRKRLLARLARWLFIVAYLGWTIYKKDATGLLAFRIFVLISLIFIETSFTLKREKLPKHIRIIIGAIITFIAFIMVLQFLDDKLVRKPNTANYKYVPLERNIPSPALEHEKRLKLMAAIKKYAAFPDKATMLLYSPEAGDEYELRKKLYEHYAAHGDPAQLDTLRSVLICPPHPPKYQMFEMGYPCRETCFAGAGMEKTNSHGCAMFCKAIGDVIVPWYPAVTREEWDDMASIMRYAINYNLKVLSNPGAYTYTAKTSRKCKMSDFMSHQNGYTCDENTVAANIAEYSDNLANAHKPRDKALFSKLGASNNILLRASGTDGLLRMRPYGQELKQLKDGLPAICSALVCGLDSPDYMARYRVFDSLGCDKYKNCSFSNRSPNELAIIPGDNRCTQ